MNARELTKALGGQWHSSNGTARCPAHDDKRPSLSISQTGRRLLVHCHAGCPQPEVVQALDKLGLWQRDQQNARQRQEVDTRRAQRLCDESTAQRADDSARSAAARSIWAQAGPIDDTPAEAYLRERGLRPGPDSWPPSLRYHGGLKHAPSGLIFAALVAAVSRWPSKQVIAVQRIFLKAGRADRTVALKPKMALAPIKGGAVRLAPAGGALALAEGIETGLAVQQATGLPVWATLGTSNLKSVLLPDSVRELIIAADSDDAGRAAAQSAGARWARAGYRVRVAAPDAGDWNDVLQKGAP